jgi:hypothetical protein
MSYGDTPPTLPPPPPGLPPQRNGCLTAFMVIGGVILLLPGLCALFFGLASLKEGSLGGIMPFVLLGLMVGAVGVLMIRWAVRDRGR